MPNRRGESLRCFSSSDTGGEEGVNLNTDEWEGLGKSPHAQLSSAARPSPPPTPPRIIKSWTPRSLPWGRRWCSLCEWALRNEQRHSGLIVPQPGETEARGRLGGRPPGDWRLGHCVSQRRRQARLLSLRFTGPPPPPPRLYGPRPARPVPAAGASPRRSRPPRLGACRARLPPAAPGARAGARPPRGCARPGGIRPERWNLSPACPRHRPATTCATRGSHPGRRRGRTGARRRADGSQPGPSPRLAPARSALPRLRPRARLAPAGPGRAHSLPSSASRRLLAAESPAARPQCLARFLAPRSRPLRPERPEAPLPTLSSRAGASREHLPGRRSCSPACRGTHPCPTGLRGERPSHLPAGRALRGPVPAGGTGAPLGRESTPWRQRGAWEEAGLCPSPGSPYPGPE